MACYSRADKILISGELIVILVKENTLALAISQAFEKFGDRVIITTNIYKKRVFNGLLGQSMHLRKRTKG